MTISRSPAWVPPRVPAASRLFLALAGRLRYDSLHLVTSGSDVQIDGTGLPLMADLRIIDWRACECILRSSDVGFVEAYRDGWINSGNLTNLLRLIIVSAAMLDQVIFGNALAYSVLHLCHPLRRNSRRGSRYNIHLHYDLGNDFYRLWLDEGMAYSSACFNDNLRYGLAEVQAVKYQRAYDVLKVEPGMDVLGIGCGWGGLMEVAYACGAHVHSVTLLEEQHRYTAGRLAGELWARVELRDYRDLNGAYGVIASIETFGAVGEAYWPSYFRTLMRCLRHGGRTPVQSITIDGTHFERYRINTDFIQQFIFPGSMLPSHERFIKLAEQHSLRVVDRLGFNHGYVKTPHHWSQRFEARLDAMYALGLDDSFIRIWRLYSAYRETGFDEGRIGVSRFLLEQG